MITFLTEQDISNNFKEDAKRTDKVVSVATMEDYIAANMPQQSTSKTYDFVVSATSNLCDTVRFDLPDVPNNTCMLLNIVLVAKSNNTGQNLAIKQSYYVGCNNSGHVDAALMGNEARYGQPIFDSYDTLTAFENNSVSVPNKLFFTLSGRVAINNNESAEFNLFGTIRTVQSR